jgi:hypothetical protein
MADDSKDGEKDRNAPTVRDIKGSRALPADTIPDVVGQYVPPRAPPEATHHRTIDLKAVRLSDEADPRRWRTQRRLVSPERSPSRSRLPLALVVGLVLLLAFGAWALLRSPAASEDARSVALPAPESPPTASAIPPAPPVTPPRLDVPPPPVPSTAVESETQPAEPTPQRPPRPREAAKKRKDPWLE